MSDRNTSASPPPPTPRACTSAAGAGAATPPRLRDARRAARRFGIDAPKTPSPSQQWELRTVGSFTGATFDRSYAELEVQDHIQDIRETKDEISDRAATAPCAASRATTCRGCAGT